MSLLVGAHLAASWRWIWLNPFKSMAGAEGTGTAVAIYAGTTAAGAVVAGFAGVVLIFAISAQGPRVRMFRDRGGTSLRRTWLVVVAEPFAATFLGIIAAVTQTTSGRVVAPFLFELAVVLLVHGALRLIWLLSELVRIVAADDKLVTENERVVPLSQIFPSANNE
ncbi:MAG: hypothetical protein WBV74_08600 [Pseudonocardiaceae bacterium]